MQWRVCRLMLGVGELNVVWIKQRPHGGPGMLTMQTFMAVTVGL